MKSKVVVSYAEDFSRYIREARLASGMTQEDIADRVGVSRVTVARWEGGQSMSSRHVVLMCKALPHIVDCLSRVTKQ